MNGQSTRTTTRILQRNPHSDIAEMLAKDGYINETHTIQISTCHRNASICFDTREVLLKFTNTEHLLLNEQITFQPDHDDKIRVSIENLPIELPDKEVKTFLSKYITPVGKTYYPGIKHHNKFFTTGTRVYQCVNLTQHIPKHVYQFGRYLRIQYDDQPKDQQPQQNIPDTPITELPDDTPEIQKQEQEISQQKTQPQPQQEIQKTRKFDFNDFVQSMTAKIKKSTKFRTITNRNKTKNTEH